MRRREEGLNLIKMCSMKYIELNKNIKNGFKNQGLER